MKEEKTLLIDIDSMIYYGASKEGLQEGIDCIKDRMNNMFEDNKTNNIISFVSQSKTFRHNLARTKPYKYNRKKLEKPEWFDFIKSYIKESFNTYHYEGLEADDCVSYFASKIPNTTVCSIDKDVLKQCVGTNYSYQLVKNKELLASNGITEWYIKGFNTVTEEESEKFLWIQALAGDSTDGILGIERVGLKGAEKMVNSWSREEYPIRVLEKYIEKYGQVEGSTRFAENFRLVYLLKNDEDIKRELGRELELPIAKKITL